MSPAKSKSQANLFAAAEHGAKFQKARKVRASMTKDQMADFARTPRKGLPTHVAREGTTLGKLYKKR